MQPWTFANNEYFHEIFDLNWRLHQSGGIATYAAEALAKPPVSKPTPDDMWMLCEMRRCWDWLDRSKFIECLEQTRDSYLHGTVRPSEGWLILGLTSQTNPEYERAPETLQELVLAISIISSGDDKFEKELYAWIKKHESKVRHALSWILPGL